MCLESLKARKINREKGNGKLEASNFIIFAGPIASAGVSEPNGPGDFTSEQFSKFVVCSNRHGSRFGERNGSVSDGTAQ